MMASIGFKRTYSDNDLFFQRPPKRFKHSGQPAISSANLKTKRDPLAFQKQPSPSPQKMSDDIQEISKQLQQEIEKRNKGEKAVRFANDDKPLFTTSDLETLCRQMLKDQEERIRNEYERLLTDKLSEQYDTFLKFTRDEIHKQVDKAARPSYLS